MESLVFLTENCGGIIKGRACKNVRSKQDWVNNEEVSSPTVALESVILMAVIDAHEDIEVAIMDIPNYFIQNNNPKKWEIMEIL